MYKSKTSNIPTLYDLFSGCAESEGFPDLSSFVEERKEHELDAMFANRFTVVSHNHSFDKDGEPMSVLRI